jgi:signal transduction histidine kinase/CheY-like chemotaxis protein
MITVVILGLATGSVGTTGGHRLIFSGYAIPTLSLLIGMWLYSFSQTLDLRDLAMATMGVAFSVVLFVLARDAYRLFRESLEIRTEQLALTGQLRQALAESEAANTAKTRFLASASHDLRQPVHTLDLFIGALDRQNLEDKTRLITDHLKVAAGDLSNQLDALLDVSRLDAGVVEVTREPVALHDLAEALQTRYGPLAREKDIVLRVSCPPELYTCTDPTHLEAILGNLVSNAIKYTDVGEVEVAVVAEDDQLRIRVNDTGRGIAPDELGRIFEEFYQIDNPNRDKSKGLGLGLAIARRLAELLGLSIEVTSREHSGSSFSFILPRSDQTPSSHYRSIVNTDIGDTRVLAVDDEPEVIAGLRVALEARGCIVETATNTAAALEHAQAEEPDVLICDFRLAGSDNGLATIDAIRDLYPEKPAILITGDTAPDRLRDATEADVLLMHKPVKEPDLAAAIAAVMKAGKV